MFGSIMIDVALGMVVIYLVLSLAASVALEVWMEALQRRGQLLHAHVVGLLGRTAAAVFYADARVLALRSGSGRINRWVTAWHLRRVYGHDACQPAAGEAADTLLRRALARIRDAAGQRFPSYVPEQTFADVVLGWTRAAGSGRVLAPTAAMADGERLPLTAALIDSWSEHYRDCGGDVSAYRAALAEDFRQSTERLSGEYRRRARWGLLGIGFVLALLVDASTPRVLDQLFVTPEVRGALVDVATQIATDARSSDAQRLDAATFASFREASDGLLRWIGDTQHSMWSDWPTVFYALLGYAITALAISLGATFWFTALQKLLSLRNAKQAVEQAHAREAQHQALVSTAGSSVAAATPELPLDLDELARWSAERFHPAANEAQPTQALYLGLCAWLAYLQPAALRAHPAWQALALQQATPIQSQGCNVWLLAGGSHRVVAFRGTEGALDDILADAQFALVDEADAGRVHRGFHRYLDAVWTPLEAALQGATGPVWFTGHSLGGALAVLAARRWQQACSSDRAAWLAGVCTFGQPRVGDSKFAAAYDRALRTRTQRYINHCDIVPTLPPSAAAAWWHKGDAPRDGDGRFDYAHVGQEYYFDVIGQLHTGPDLFQRLLDRFLMPDAALRDREAFLAWASRRGKEHVGDHGMLEYLRLLAQARGND